MSKAYARARGICQFCGSARAKEAHHWAGTKLAGPYPPDRVLTGDDLTALCRNCHHIATALRWRLYRRGVTDEHSDDLYETRLSDLFDRGEVRAPKVVMLSGGSRSVYDL